MPNPVNMFHISVHSASRQAPYIVSMLHRCHSISELCRTITASSLKANVNTWKISAPILPIRNNNLMHLHCSLKSVIFWRNKHCTGHNTWSPGTAMHATWNQQQTTTQVLLHHHIDDEFCTNCSSCGGQGVMGGNLTLQWKDPSADQYASLPMVVEKCPSEQILWDIFLATETFVFYIQFFQN